MAVYGTQLGINYTSSTSGCTDTYGCGGTCSDFVIKRHDIKPPWRVSVSDCDGPLDLTDENLVLEVNMWAKAKFKKAVAAEDDSFALADGIGFDQVLPGDIIIVDRVRSPEHMLVTGIDETQKLIIVERGYNGSTASDWSRGSPIRIFRTWQGVGEIQMEYEDQIQEDGTTLTDQLVATYLVYNWNPNDTCLPGCYWLEFKLLQMNLLGDTSTTSSIISTNGCGMGTGVEWQRRFPQESEGFLIKITDSPTAEL